MERLDWTSADRVAHHVRSSLRLLVTFPILVYQKLVSPALPGACIYTPTCSQYAQQAIMRHGIARGLLMGFLRIFRCAGGLFAGGYDPVPQEFSFRQLIGRYSQFRHHGSSPHHDEE